MSNYVKATNFYAKDALLTGDPDKIIKGAEIDDEFNAIATAIATKANINSPNFTGIPTAPTATLGDATTKIATTQFVENAIDNIPSVVSIPSGVILLWSGTAATIPAGWYLCNGTNGTPNLRDKFIVGAGTSYNPGDTGGVSTHTHTNTGTVGSTTLTIDQIPSHTHEAVAEIVGNGGNGYTTSQFTHIEFTGESGAAGGNGSHTHTFSGSNSTESNLPPYYALCYIMKA